MIFALVSSPGSNDNLTISDALCATLDARDAT